VGKTLVTCASGTISSQLVTELRQQGVDTRAGVRDTSKAQRLARLGAEVVACDLDSASSLEEALDGVENLFLLSPFVEDMVPSLELAVRAARAAGVRFILRASASGANPNAELPIAAQHGRCEGIVKESGIGWAILQPTFFQDNFLTAHKPALLSQGTFYGASGGGKTAYVSTRDIAQVAAQILIAPSPHRGRTLVLTGPEALGDAEAALVLSRALGKPVSFTSLTGEQYRQGLLQQGVPVWAANDLVGLERVKAQGRAASLARTVREMLGRPAESFAAYVERNVDRFRAAKGRG
jgi:uncharacterized protein YbjT (DUF2867 family)